MHFPNSFIFLKKFSVFQQGCFSEQTAFAEHDEQSAVLYLVRNFI